MVLCNPVCTVLYAVAAWAFFKDRIPYEEALLLQFYKSEYVRYAASTIVGIPFVQSPAAEAASAGGVGGGGGGQQHKQETNAGK